MKNENTLKSRGEKSSMGRSETSVRPKRKRKQRRDAAEKVCWNLLILMGVGELEQIPLNLRPLLTDEMQKWADLAVPDRNYESENVMERVIRFKGKPRPVEGDNYAARFDGSPESVGAILAVAQKVDSAAEAAVVPELDVVVVRWTRLPDDHPAMVEYEVVERGKWLAFSEATGSIYNTDDNDLEHWYERA